MALGARQQVKIGQNFENRIPRGGRARASLVYFTQLGDTNVVTANVWND